jgi:hypothetical protein
MDATIHCMIEVNCTHIKWGCLLRRAPDCLWPDRAGSLEIFGRLAQAETWEEEQAVLGDASFEMHDFAYADEIAKAPPDHTERIGGGKV